MSPPRDAPCDDWATWADVESCRCAGLPDGEPDEDKAAHALEVATDELWNRTGRRFGLCSRTVRPCIRCTCRRDLCTCGAIYRDQLLLDRTPVAEVTEVVVNGAALPADAYRVDDWRWLVRLDGETWPYCADLATEPDEPGVFAVTFRYGRTVPRALVDAAAALACQLYLRCLALPCALPEGIQLVQREGLTFKVLDRGALAGFDVVGVDAVDPAIRTWAPGGRFGATTGFCDPAQRQTSRRVDTSPASGSS